MATSELLLVDEFRDFEDEELPPPTQPSPLNDRNSSVADDAEGSSDGYISESDVLFLLGLEKGSSGSKTDENDLGEVVTDGLFTQPLSSREFKALLSPDAGLLSPGFNLAARSACSPHGDCQQPEKMCVSGHSKENVRPRYELQPPSPTVKCVLVETSLVKRDHGEIDAKTGMADADSRKKPKVKRGLFQEPGQQKRPMAKHNPLPGQQKISDFFKAYPDNTFSCRRIDGARDFSATF